MFMTIKSLKKIKKSERCINNMAHNNYSARQHEQQKLEEEIRCLFDVLEAKYDKDDQLIVREKNWRLAERTHIFFKKMQK